MTLAWSFHVPSAIARVVVVGAARKLIPFLRSPLALREEIRRPRALEAGAESSCKGAEECLDSGKGLLPLIYHIEVLV